jgi:hypothetical protein
MSLQGRSQIDLAYNVAALRYEIPGEPVSALIVKFIT